MSPPISHAIVNLQHKCMPHMHAYSKFRNANEYQSLSLTEEKPRNSGETGVKREYLTDFAFSFKSWMLEFRLTVQNDGMSIFVRQN